MNGFAIEVSFDNFIRHTVSIRVRSKKTTTMKISPAHPTEVQKIPPIYH
jgi:hypothetical protein